MRAWAAADPGLALLLLGMILATGLYAPTFGYGIVSYDDPWLYQNNFIVQNASWDSLRTIFTDLDPQSPMRHTLAPEYLPARDLSVMLDFAVWGDFYPGFHVTNLLIYLLAIAMLFRMLDAFGFDRTIAGLAVLVWAIHPVHAESVAWLSERKGLLGIMFAATAGFAYARFRAGASAHWLIAATLATVAAVWSKAPAAFTIAGLAGLEIVLPAKRVSWRRSLAGLATIAVIGVIAFLPVVALAIKADVVGDSIIPGDHKTEIVLGVHGHYVRLAAMMMPNAISYPISSNGPSALDLVFGGAGVIALAAAFVPRLRAGRELRGAAIIWVSAWLPVGHLVLPLHQVGVADRYALVMVLGGALGFAVLVRKLAQSRLEVALVAVVALAASVRTLDARTNWGSDLLLWERAVRSNPHDGRFWSYYAHELEMHGLMDEAERAVEVGLSYGDSPRLLFRRGMQKLARGERDLAIQSLRHAAEKGDADAMANLAQLLLPRGERDEALKWGRRATKVAPMAVHARKSHGVAALAAGHVDEARRAFDAALVLEPTAANRYGIAIAMLELGHPQLATPLLEACVDDPGVGSNARAKLAAIRAGRL